MSNHKLHLLTCREKPIDANCSKFKPVAQQWLQHAGCHTFSSNPLGRLLNVREIFASILATQMSLRGGNLEVLLRQCRRDLVKGNALQAPEIWSTNLTHICGLDRLVIVFVCPVGRSLCWQVHVRHSNPSGIVCRTLAVSVDPAHVNWNSDVSHPQLVLFQLVLDQPSPRRQPLQYWKLKIVSLTLGCW